MLGSIAIVLLISAGRGAEPDPAKTMEQAATEWIKVRKETARLEAEWSAQRPLLESMAGRLAEHAQELQEKRDLILAKTAADRTDLSRVQEAGRIAADESRSCEAQLKVLTNELLQLRPSLPPHLSVALELPYRSLAAPDVSLNDRMQFNLVVLNRCLQFNRSITCQKEILTLDGGTNPQLCEVIYWGLSHGYAYDRSTDKAWYGAPDHGSWHWAPLPEAASSVARLVAAYYGKGDPGFIEVPARLKTASIESAKN